MQSLSACKRLLLSLTTLHAEYRDEERQEFLKEVAAVRLSYCTATLITTAYKTCPLINYRTLTGFSFLLFLRINCRLIISARAVAVQFAVAGFLFSFAYPLSNPVALVQPLPVALQTQHILIRKNHLHSLVYLPH
jgi:hypothetical protein